MKSISPIRAAAYQNMQLNAGMFLIDFDHSAIKTAAALRTALAGLLTTGEKLLGVTRGGGTFVVSQETREPDVDGKRYRFVGGTFVDSVDAYLTGTLLEITPENLTKLMATGDSEVSDKVTTITMRTAIASGDYIHSLVWVGDIADGSVVLIDLKNALNTTGLTMTFTDKGEGTIPFEFHAHQDSVNDTDTAPFTVKYFKD